MIANAQRLYTYFRKHWFHLLWIGLLLFVLLKKDLSFHLQLNSPAQPESPQPVDQGPEESFTEWSAPPENGQKLGLSSAPSEPGLVLLQSVEALDPGTVRSFLDRFADVAKAEEKKFGLPAAIILGHALLISKAGKSIIAEEANNYFALPCTSDWKGPRSSFDGSCLRAYPNAWTSFRDHSLYLTTGSRADLRKLKGKSIGKWIEALSERDFRQIPDYELQLQAAIRTFRLEDY